MRLVKYDITVPQIYPKIGNVINTVIRYTNTDIAPYGIPLTNAYKFLGSLYQWNIGNVEENAPGKTLKTPPQKGPSVLPR